MRTRYGSFFVVLPDVDTSIEPQLPSVANVRLCHPSGRTWLLARLDQAHLRIHADGDVRIAIIGQTSATAGDVERIARRVQTPRQLAAQVRHLDGSRSVVASLGGVTYAAGTAAQTRRIFHALIGRIRIIADRADLLAELGGFAVDDTALVLRLAGDMPHPANDVPMWQQVTAVPGGDFVAVQRDGTTVSAATWWHRPRPTLPRSNAAERLRESMAAAVRARTPPSADVACDLSGGLDSTPLCYFAARGPRGVVARTFYTEDPGGREDLLWAERALPSMPGIREHQVFTTKGLPDFYGGLDVESHLDEPTQAAAAAPRIRHMLDDDVRQGLRTHLTGLGGDHLFRGVKPWNHALAGTMPVRAWQRARAEDAASRVRRLTTLRQMLDHSTYAQWFTRAIGTAISGVEPPDLPRLNDWSVPFRFPPWLSIEARQLLIDALTRCSRDAEPLGQNRAGHLDISTLREAGRAARGTSFLGQAVGVSYDAPLLDDHVVEAVFSATYDARDSPLEWKPLMKAAMQGLLPESYLRRTSKIGGGPQSVRGYLAHYESLVNLWEGSGLLDCGLVDRDLLLRTVEPSNTKAPPVHVRTLTDVAIFMRDWRRTRNQVSLGK